MNKIYIQIIFTYLIYIAIASGIIFCIGGVITYLCGGSDLFYALLVAVIFAVSMIIMIFSANCYNIWKMR
jgi:hypothetical protein